MSNCGGKHPNWSEEYTIFKCFNLTVIWSKRSVQDKPMVHSDGTYIQEQLMCKSEASFFLKQVLRMYSVKPIKLNTQYHGLPAPYPPNLKVMYIIKKIWPPVNTISCYTCIYFKVFVTNNSYHMICLLTLNNFALRTTAVDQNDIS